MEADRFGEENIGMGISIGVKVAHRANAFLNLVLQAQRLSLALGLFPARWSEATP